MENIINANHYHSTSMINILIKVDGLMIFCDLSHIFMMDSLYFKIFT